MSAILAAKSIIGAFCCGRDEILMGRREVALAAPALAPRPANQIMAVGNGMVSFRIRRNQ
jgi:hypothetical protein